jgi:hypothetical protein
MHEAVRAAVRRGSGRPPARSVPRGSLGFRHREGAGVLLEEEVRPPRSGETLREHACHGPERRDAQRHACSKLDGDQPVERPGRTHAPFS